MVTFSTEGVDEIDLVSALIELSENDTLSDPVSGKLGRRGLKILSI